MSNFGWGKEPWGLFPWGGTIRYGPQYFNMSFNEVTPFAMIMKDSSTFAMYSKITPPSLKFASSKEVPLLGLTNRVEDELSLEG